MANRRNKNSTNMKLGKVTKRKGGNRKTITKEMLECATPQNTPESIHDSEKNEIECEENRLAEEDDVPIARYPCEPKATVSTTTCTDESGIWPNQNWQTPIDKFFSLMLASVKRLSPEDQFIVKNRIYALVNEMEGKYLDLKSLYETTT